MVADEPTKAAAVLGVVVAPGLAHDVTSRVADELVEDLRERHGAVTVVIGILSLYLALFAIVLSGAGLVISSDVLAGAVGDDVGLSDYVTVAWFVASFATIGGALGAALESGDAVRQAAYAATADQDEGSEEST